MGAVQAVFGRLGNGRSKDAPPEALAAAVSELCWSFAGDDAPVGAEVTGKSAGAEAGFGEATSASKSWIRTIYW